jgi:hypothetical protein
VEKISKAKQSKIQLRRQQKKRKNKKIMILRAHHPLRRINQPEFMIGSKNMI